MTHNQHWYAVYTRSCWEKKAAAVLTELGIENYCPLQKKERRWSDRKKIIEEPVFKSYVFVNISEQQKLTVLEVSGILNFVHYLGKPARIQNQEIQTIRQFLNDYKNVRLETDDFAVNDQVRILRGALMMREGNVIEVKNKTVTVFLPSLGFKMVAEIEKTNLVQLNISTAV